MGGTDKAASPVPSAREDYPLRGNDTRLFSRLHSEMCDEIDALRVVAVAAWAWRRTKYAMHGNTSEASQRHAEAVRFAERNLREKVEAHTVDGPSDDDLPGMWSHSDFLGGDPDERSHTERSTHENTESPS